jgi:adenylate cyclase
MPVVPELVTDFEAKTYDLRCNYEVRLRDKKLEMEDIIIVDIDERSLEKLGNFRQWPWAYHARLIDYLAKCQARAIGFDVLFFERQPDPKQCDSLVASTAASQKVAHAVFFSAADQDNFRPPMEEDPVEKLAPRFAYHFQPQVTRQFLTEERLEGPFEELTAAAHNLGYTNPHPDGDGVNRQIPLFKNILSNSYPALSLAMAIDLLGISHDQVKVVPGKYIALGDTVKIPMHRQGDTDGWMLINYYGDFKTFRYISYYDVVKRRVPPPFFKDKIILVGASAAGLMDLRATPIQAVYPGVEIHATLIQNIINNDFLTKAKPWVMFLVIILLGILAGTITLLFKPIWTAALNILMSAGYFVVSYQVFAKYDLWIDVVRPVVTILFTYMGIMMYRYLTEEKEKKFIRGAFQHYLSPTVIAQLTENPAMLKLGGEKKVLTAFFSDIAGFSTFSEKLSPEDLVKLLNEYLTAKCDIILKYEGTVDKFEGDAVIAFFGAPISYEDHARRACWVSLEMQHVMMPALREKWSKEPHWPDIVAKMRMRIGLNTGPMVVGNMGSRTRMDYTMMGDSVNLAARLEGVNKQYGTYIMISEFTRTAASDHIETRMLDKIRVVGKSEPVKVYELLARKGELSDVDRRMAAAFEAGLELYQTQQWDAAIAKFKETMEIKPGDPPSKKYIERCEDFKKSPPPAGWDGVYNVTSK